MHISLLQDHLVTERKEKPTSVNAFELISRSQSFNLENLFDKQVNTFTFTRHLFNTLTDMSSVYNVSNSIRSKNS